MIRHRIVIAILLLTNVTCMPALAGYPRKTTAMVVPARYSVIQFCMDIVNLKPVSLVTYRPRKDSNTPLMHIWNRRRHKWVEISLAEYSSGAAFKTRPTQVILVGNDQTLPADLADLAWCSDIKRVNSLNIPDLLNALNEPLNFSTANWRWLAARYKVEIKDLNYEHRRYGKYGPPRGIQSRIATEPAIAEKPAPLTLEEMIEMLPAESGSSAKVDYVKPTAEQVEKGAEPAPPTDETVDQIDDLPPADK